MTSVIKLSILEMFKLYTFVAPELLFFTLPITFFVAATLTLHKLSSDNEMTVIFALGIKPFKVLSILSTPALFLTLILIFDFFIMIPHTKTLSSNFIQYKTSEAKFNLGASEFGHNFGDWMLYIGNNNNEGTYGDVFLFNKSDKEEILIGAQTAEVISEGGIMKLKLKDGEGYSYTDQSLSQMNFSSMIINDMMNFNLDKYQTPIDYWLGSGDNIYIKKRKHRKFIMYSILSLFPILSIFSVMGIGIVNARHQQGHLYLSIFLVILFYYGAAFGLRKTFMFYTIPLVTITWISVTYYLYRTKVVARF